MKQPQEEVQASVAQAPQLANCITFHGKISTDLIQLDDYSQGFILRGDKGEEFPLIILKLHEKGEKFNLEKGDSIASIGILKKRDNEWVIEVVQLFRIPSEEELQKMT